jgi:WXG100 family type VII secretion target
MKKADKEDVEMRSIAVEPEQLEASAARIEEHNQDYSRAYAQLFDAVDTMKAGWQGKDNTAFSTQISKFQTDFREMSVLCSQYVEFLRNSAKSYRQMQEDLASQAANLAQ